MKQLNKLYQLSPGSEVTENDNQIMKEFLAYIYYLNETKI